MDISYHERPNYLLVEMSGTWEIDEAKRQIEAVRNRASTLGAKRVLIDCRELATPKDTLTRFLTGEYIAKFWRPPVKVAALAGQDMVNNKFAEIVAVNRGAWFSVFLEEKLAVQWLMEGID